jgi:1,4-alpha-glucan branching enzyme
VPFGATADATGTSFRVWAPSATAAALHGEFSVEPVPLRALGDGTFAAYVAGARPGQRYRYALTTRDGSTLMRLDPYGRKISGGESVIVDPQSYRFNTAPYQRSGKNTLVVYEMHVGSYYCPGAPDACGFASTAAHLDELADLGVNVIELMPVNAHGSQRGWGYNPHAYYAPHWQYGAPDELRHLVDEAHARGIAVALDMVYNHYDGWKKAPLYCFDGECGTGNGVYFFSDPKYRSTPWGPRFDYQRPEVADFIANNITFWRSEYRIDGFRWDSVSNIRAIDGNGSVPGGVALLRRGNELAKKIPGALLIAEDLKGYAAVTAKLDDGGMGFDSQWDGGFHHALQSAVLGYDDSARNIDAVRDALYGRYNGDPFERIIYTESHDTVGNGGARLPSRIDPADPGSFAARKRSMLAAAILLTAPGIPMLFAGQEMLSIGTFADPPEPLDWSRRQAHARVVAFYKDMIALRRNAGGFTPGLLGSNIDVYHLNGASKVLAYRRSAAAGSDVIVIANFMNKAYTRYDVGLPFGGVWRVRMNSDDQKYSLDFGGAASTDVQAAPTPLHGQPYSAPIALGPYSVVVLSR